MPESIKGVCQFWCDRRLVSGAEGEILSDQRKRFEIPSRQILTDKMHKEDMLERKDLECTRGVPEPNPSKISA